MADKFGLWERCEKFVECTTFVVNLAKSIDTAPRVRSTGAMKAELNLNRAALRHTKMRVYCYHGVTRTELYVERN
jgi:hypothetical protein